LQGFNVLKKNGKTENVKMQTFFESFSSSTGGVSSFRSSKVDKVDFADSFVGETIQETSFDKRNGENGMRPERLIIIRQHGMFFS